MTLVLEWVKKLLGIGGLAGSLTLVAGVLVLIGAISNWLRDDAIKDCNASWKLVLTQRTAKLQTEATANALRVKELEQKLSEALADADAAKQSEKVALEKQRESIPENPDCTKCRIPNERIWLRRDGKAAARSSLRPGS